jgi:multidrug efflux pump subunit AcrA (membrane-fusion protein)
VDTGARLVELKAVSGIGVRFEVAPSIARLILPSMAFVIHDSVTGRDWRGSVVTVGGGVDSESGLVRVEGVLDTAGNAPPFIGEYFSGEIVVGKSPAGLVAPESSLSVTDEKTFVHLVDENGVARAVPVHVLGDNAGTVVLEGEGLEAGALVISDGNFNLPDGTPVLVRQ